MSRLNRRQDFVGRVCREHTQRRALSTSIRWLVLGAAVGLAWRVFVDAGDVKPASVDSAAAVVPTAVPQVVDPSVIVHVAAPPQMPPVQVVQLTRQVMKETLGGLLQRAGVKTAESQTALSAMRPTLDERRLRAGDWMTVRVEDGALVSLVIQRLREDGVPETIRVVRTGQGTFTTSTESPPVRVQIARLSGTVRGTLYDSMVAAGEMPTFINHFVAVFDSQVDFHRETRNGDTFRALVEKRYAGDRFVGYGRVLAAEYKQSWRLLRGFDHVAADGTRSYYDDQGRSLLTGLLKTPMEFTRITSSYGTRFHPVLQQKRPHHGVDYGAPVCTPVWSVGDGKVVVASYRGDCGNMVAVQHGNNLESGYCHLSRIATGIKPGVRVSQKQVIGYVGATGRTTGAHLHFQMMHHGQYVNPQKVDAPRRQGLTGAELEQFQQKVRGWSLELDSIPVG